MAKIVLSFDTVDKTATASIDGVDIPNFQSLQVYGGHKGKYGIELSSGVEDEANDMRAWTRVCASDSKLDQLIDKNVSELTQETQDELLDFFGKK